MSMLRFLDPRELLLFALNAALSPAPRFVVVNGVRMPLREGGWVMLASAGISLAGALYSSNKASNSANDALNQSKNAELSQLDLANEQNSRSQAMFQRYMGTYVPLQNAYLKMLTKPVDPNAQAGMAKADVEKAAAQQRQVTNRNNMGYGLDPNSGRAAEMRRENSIDTTAQAAGAATSARRWANQQNIQRAGIAAGSGESLIGAAGSFANGAAGGYGQVGNTALQAGGLYAGYAGQYGNAAGSALGTILNHFYPGGISPTPSSATTPPPPGQPDLSPVDNTPVNIPPPIDPVTAPGG